MDTFRILCCGVALGFTAGAFWGWYINSKFYRKTRAIHWADYVTEKCRHCDKS